jgi:hypothetical protein
VSFTRKLEGTSHKLFSEKFFEMEWNVFLGTGVNPNKRTYQKKHSKVQKDSIALIYKRIVMFLGCSTQACYLVQIFFISIDLCVWGGV